jgi:hypothetical protein
VCRVKVTASGKKHVENNRFVNKSITFLFWLETMFKRFPVFQNK